MFYYQDIREAMQSLGDITEVGLDSESVMTYALGIEQAQGKLDALDLAIGIATGIALERQRKEADA